MSPGKLKHLTKLSNSAGVIAAAAMDQRGSLRKMMADAKGVDEAQISDAMLSEFKVAVSKALTPHTSAMLLDTAWGLPAANARDRNAGLLLAYEMDNYGNTRPGRMPALVPELSVSRIAALGANGVKILVHYTPFEDGRINDHKQAFVERIGAECASHDIPFFLEFVGYDEKGGGEKSFEFARRKPEIVIESMREFSRPQYMVDVLKVEVPVNAEYVEGSLAYKGRGAQTREEALDLFRRAAAVTDKPFIYLSAGVDSAVFIEGLRMAVEANTNFSGVLCGRATWKDGVPVYVNRGLAELEKWLAVEGVRNVAAINEVIASAKPWRARPSVLD